MNILLKLFPTSSPGVPTCKRETKAFKTKDSSLAFSGALPCLFFVLINFLLNSKGPQETCC